jgi:hypothetical protein
MPNLLKTQILRMQKVMEDCHCYIPSYEMAEERIEVL